MLNTGREEYENISIPDDKLLAAIGRGIHKERSRRKKELLRSFLTVAAACILILFGCANIPAVYAYASGIPVIKEFVQALRIGGGGKEMGNVTAEINSDSGSVTISFFKDGEITDAVLSYSVSYHYAPARVQIVFHGIDSSFGALLEKKMSGIDAVADVYSINTLNESDFACVVVLNELYNYELMEFLNPGSLMIRFYQDAYYTADEKHPGQIVYFLRTDAVSSDKELESLLIKYQDEDPVQIKNQQGEYLFAIGRYDTEEEAQQEYRAMLKKYGVDNAFYVSSERVEDVPVK